MASSRYIALAFLFSASLANAQLAKDAEESKPEATEQERRPVNNAWMAGWGRISTYDEYLSILAYSGNVYSLTNERFYSSRWLDGKLQHQHRIIGEFANTYSPAQNSEQYVLNLHYKFNLPYRWIKREGFSFSSGFNADISAGALYNSRNGNNPVSASVFTDVGYSFMAKYRWKSLLFRWQADVPVAGIAFAPHYGQSYYEISLAPEGDLLLFTSLHNTRGLYSFITADFPLQNCSFRLGYSAMFRQTRYNDIVAHNYSHNILFGMVFETSTVSYSQLKNRAIRSAYYD
jgi:hypothetical protein